jgi:hypothetical protein
MLRSMRDAVIDSLTSKNEGRLPRVEIRLLAIRLDVIVQFLVGA